MGASLKFLNLTHAMNKKLGSLEPKREANTHLTSYQSRFGSGKMGDRCVLPNLERAIDLENVYLAFRIILGKSTNNALNATS